MNSIPTRTFTIGELAEKAGVPVDTIRHYERQGLLPATARRASGYRQYDPAAIERVRFIRRAKSLGFSLEEICELLSFSTDREHGVEHIKQRASERLQEITERIDALVVMRDALQKLVGACPGSGEPECCPILANIQGAGDDSVADMPVAARALGCCGAPGSSRTVRES
ncbi:MAG: heavy metal-responsive transcriptional regulator [Rhodocyclaceae bacterium]